MGLANPDQRVVIIKEYAKKHFKETPVLDFALEVEQLTTRKRANLILNVDGCIAVAFVDMIRSCGAFTREECDDLMSFGCLNGLFGHQGVGMLRLRPYRDISIQPGPVFVVRTAALPGMDLAGSVQSSRVQSIASAQLHLRGQC